MISIGDFMSSALLCTTPHQIEMIVAIELQMHCFHMRQHFCCMPVGQGLQISAHWDTLAQKRSDNLFGFMLHSQQCDSERSCKIHGQSLFEHPCAYSISCLCKKKSILDYNLHRIRVITLFLCPFCYACRSRYIIYLLSLFLAECRSTVLNRNRGF